jgi:fumarate hydratase class II
VDAVTARHDQEVSNADLLQRVERIEAELRRITATLTGGAPVGTGARAWIGYMGRRVVETGKLRRALGIDPPPFRAPRPPGPS